MWTINSPNYPTTARRSFDLYILLRPRLLQNPGELADPSGFVPVFDVEIRIFVERHAVRGVEDARLPVRHRDVEVGPLLLISIVADDGDDSVVLVEDRDARFQFRHRHVLAVKRN